MPVKIYRVMYDSPLGRQTVWLDDFAEAMQLCEEKSGRIWELQSVGDPIEITKEAAKAGE